MVSYFIGYGTNYIGGGDESIKNGAMHDASWLVPICIQLIPSTILAVGMIAFMPQSPRHLMNKGREEECLNTLARLRGCSKDDLRVRIEFLEIKALREFEVQRSIELFPQYQDGSFKSNFMIGLNDYKSLLTNKSLRKRTMIAVLTMVFQQWNGGMKARESIIHCCHSANVVSSKRHSLLCTFYLPRRWHYWWNSVPARNRRCGHCHVFGHDPSRPLR